tara:strand:+ start:2258 stop:2500 length:243 start_codon:yes stop_codon:yes gene_type:complete
MDPVNIIVNGTQETVKPVPLTFDAVVNLAYETPPYGDNTSFSITYRRSKNTPQLEGIMNPGDSLKPSEGMIFDVTATDRS